MTHEQLPQADMLADDIYGNQKEWYCKESVIALITTTAQRVRAETIEEVRKAIYKIEESEQSTGTYDYQSFVLGYQRAIDDLRTVLSTLNK